MGDRDGILSDYDEGLPSRRRETQTSISSWANETFGPAGSNARVAARANEEMAELLRALTADDASPKAGAEVADIVIVLYRLATRLGIDLHAEIDRKMAINRAREWKLDATGHGYHVRPKGTDAPVAAEAAAPRRGADTEGGRGG
jgi:hypothetical protein